MAKWILVQKELLNPRTQAASKASLALDLPALPLVVRQSELQGPNPTHVEYMICQPSGCNQE